MEESSVPSSSGDSISVIQIKIVEGHRSKREATGAEPWRVMHGANCPKVANLSVLRGLKPGDESHSLMCEPVSHWRALSSIVEEKNLIPRRWFQGSVAMPMIVTPVSSGKKNPRSGAVLGQVIP
jgi:hypothetical protein